MTAQDVARQLDPTYAVAADRAEQLRKQAAEVAKSIAHYEGVLQANQEAGDRRWQEMGFLRQVAHKTGARRDHWLSLNEDREQWAQEELAKLDPRQRRAGAAIAGGGEDRGHGLRADRACGRR